MPDAGCIEKAHLVEALLEAFARPRPPASLSLRSIAQPTQCAICMSAFKEGDLLRQLSCSELCAPPRPLSILFFCLHARTSAGRCFPYEGGVFE